MLVAALLLAAVPPVTAFPRPQTDAVADCRAAACSSLGEVRVCKCATKTSPEGDRVFVEGPGERRLAWAASTYLGAVADFLAFHADLDGDSHLELIVANRAAEAGSPAVRTWEVSVVDGAQGGVLRFRSEDFGPDALAKGSVLATEWEGADAGRAFVGREFLYKDGGLLPAKDPVRRRKPTREFEAERLAALGSNDLAACTPRAWLARAATSRADEGPAAQRGAVIRGVTRDEGELELHLERDDGQLETLSSDGEVGARLRLADARTQRLFPPGYVPANAEEWLLGRKVVLALSGASASGLVLLR